MLTRFNIDREEQLLVSLKQTILNTYILFIFDRDSCFIFLTFYSFHNAGATG